MADGTERIGLEKVSAGAGGLEEALDFVAKVLEVGEKIVEGFPPPLTLAFPLWSARWLPTAALAPWSDHACSMAWVRRSVQYYESSDVFGQDEDVPTTPARNSTALSPNTGHAV